MTYATEYDFKWVFYKGMHESLIQPILRHFNLSSLTNVSAKKVWLRAWYRPLMSFTEYAWLYLILCIPDFDKNFGEAKKNGEKRLIEYIEKCKYNKYKARAWAKVGWRVNQYGIMEYDWRLLI